MASKKLLSFGVFLLMASVSMECFAVPYQNTPVDRFGKVENGIYRGAAPKSVIDMKALKKLGIKTVINLQEADDKIALGRKFSEAAGLKFISIPLDGFWAPQDWQVDLILSKLNDPQLKPIFIHCSHGRERTGLMIGLHRVEADGWSPKAAYQEMKDYGFRWVVFRMKDYFEDRTHTDL